MPQRKGRELDWVILDKERYQISLVRENGRDFWLRHTSKPVD